MGEADNVLFLDFFPEYLLFLDFFFEYLLFLDLDCFFLFERIFFGIMLLYNVL